MGIFCINLIMPIVVQGQTVKININSANYSGSRPLSIDFINKQNSDFYIGMKKEDVYLKIDELGLDANIDSYANNYINIYSPEKKIYISLYFGNSNNNQLTSLDVIEIYNENLLTRGDLIEKMYTLYGYEYTLYQNRTPFYEAESEPFVRPDIYEYKLNNIFLKVYISDNLVEGWGISQSKIIDDFELCNTVFTSNQRLTEEDLSTLSRWELDMLRNYYFARHGYKFKCTSYSSFFYFYNWYTPKYDDVSEYLTPLDWANVNLILKYKIKKKK